MNRRQFFRWITAAGGAFVVGPLLRTRSQPRSSGQSEALPQEGGDSGLARIVVVKTSDRAEGVRRAIELLGENPVRGKQVLLKPNFNSAHQAPGSTHNSVLRSLIIELQRMGSTSITVADRSGMGNTRRVMQRKGIFEMAGEMGFAILALNELPEEEWVVRRSDGDHWRRGYAVPRLLLDSECVVQTCNLKTHRFGGHFTLSLKNSVGFVARTTSPGGYNYMGELHSSSHQRRMIAEINQSYYPALIVMDGVEAFVKGGPDTGTKVRPEVVLAGSDRVAIDAAGVAILRMYGTTPQVQRGKIFEQEQIARAVELGLGVSKASEIRLITGDSPSREYADEISRFLAGSKPT
jgi:uncharacterized protein (DUF362 family)